MTSHYHAPNLDKLSLDVGSGGTPRGNVNIELYYPRSRHTPNPIKKPTVICDAHNLPFKKDCFDEAHCIHTLEHLHSPYNCLREILRVMKHDAVLHVEEPDAARVDWEIPQHNYSWNRFTLNWILQNVGFKVPKPAAPIGKQSLKIDAIKTRWRAYGQWMGVYQLDEKPRQPINRKLEYPPRPKLNQTPDYKGADYTFKLRNMSINRLCPRTPIKDINLNALQIWINHLGRAIYNPVTAWQSPDGEIHIMPDGDHRTRILWEIGDPHVTVMLRQSKNQHPKGQEYTDWVRWSSQASEPNTYPRNLERKQGFNYYPNINPPSPTLQKYYDMQSHDGPYYRDTLDTTASIREILFQPGHGRLYREQVLDTIIEDAQIKDKTVLDACCSYGYYSHLLLEHGAKYSDCVEASHFACAIAQTIAARRQLRLKAHNCTTQHYLKSTDKTFDVCLFLNAFHHLLAKNKEDGWKTLNMLLDRSDKLYLMMGVTDPDWHVIDEFGGSIDEAVSKMAGVHPLPLLQTGYRRRILYVLSRNA